jgi:hypothetical protein
MSTEVTPSRLGRKAGLAVKEVAYRARQTLLASVGYSAINYSRVVQVINAAQHKFLAYFRERPESQNQPETGDEELGLDSKIYLEPSDQDWRDAWHVTERLLVLMRDEAKNKGSISGSLR